MQITTTFNLENEPELAELVADKAPGDNITLHCSIRELVPGKRLELRVNEAEEGSDNDEEDDEQDSEEDEGSDEEGLSAVV